MPLQNVSPRLRHAKPQDIYDAGWGDGDRIAAVDWNVVDQIARLQQVLKANGDLLFLSGLHRRNISGGIAGRVAVWAIGRAHRLGSGRGRVGWPRYDHHASSRISHSACRSQ